MNAPPRAKVNKERAKAPAGVLNRRPNIRKIISEALEKRTGIVRDVDLWVSAVRLPQAFLRFLLETDALHDMSFTLVMKGKTRWVQPKDLREACEEWSKIADEVVGEKATTGEHLNCQVFSDKSDSEISLRQFESSSFRHGGDDPLMAVLPDDPRVQQALKQMQVDDGAVDQAMEALENPILYTWMKPPTRYAGGDLVESLQMLLALSKAETAPIAGEIRKIIKLLLVAVVGNVDAEISVGPIACSVTSLAALIVRCEQSGGISGRNGISETVCAISSRALLYLSLLDAQTSAKRSLEPKSLELADICRDDWVECILCRKPLPTEEPICAWRFLERQPPEHVRAILGADSVRYLMSHKTSNIEPPNLAINGTSVLRIGMACVAAIVCVDCHRDQVRGRQIRLMPNQRSRLGSAPPSFDCEPSARR